MADSYSQYGGMPLGFDSSTGSAMPSYNIGSNTYYAYNPNSQAYAPGMSLNDQLGIAGYSNGTKQSQYNAALLSAGVDLAMSGLNYFSSLQTNKQNKEMQERAWELNSLEHRYKEYLKIGLNKQLLTGNTPNYTLSTSMKAPQFESNAIGKALDTLQALNQLDMMQIQKQNAFWQNAHLREEVIRLAHDNDVYSTRKNLAHDDSQLLKLIYGGRDVLGIPEKVNTLPELFRWLFTGYHGNPLNAPTYEDPYGDASSVPSSEKASPVITDEQTGRKLYLDSETGEYFYRGSKNNKIYTGVYAW